MLKTLKKSISRQIQKEKRGSTSTVETNTFYGEQIINGGAETITPGNPYSLPGWTSYECSIRNDNERSGVNGFYVGNAGAGNWGYMKQILNVPVDGITSFSLWYRWMDMWPSNFDIVITYSDTSTTTISKVGLTAWQEADIKPLLDAGKTITEIKIIKTTQTYGLDIDDISLIGWTGE